MTPAEMLEEAREAGVELDRHLIEDAWDVSISPTDLAAIYTAPSSLESGIETTS